MKNSDVDDDSNEGDNLVQENIMQVATLGVEDDIEQVEDAYANNMNTQSPKIRISMIFEDDGWVIQHMWRI